MVINHRNLKVYKKNLLVKKIQVYQQPKRNLEISISLMQKIIINIPVHSNKEFKPKDIFNLVNIKKVNIKSKLNILLKKVLV